MFPFSRHRLVSMKRFSLLLGIAVVSSAGMMRAELTWDARRIELAPSVFETAADAKFGFVNSGDQPVIIESAKSSCGCTIPKLEKNTYAPGERGEIVAHFNIGDRRGIQNVAIQVAIRGKQAPDVLSLVLKIPIPASVTPSMLVWGKDESNAAKTIMVEAMEGLPLRVEKVQPSNADFDTSVETEQEGAKYRIVVTPKSTARSSVTVLNIDTLLGDKKKMLQAYAQVRAAGPPRQVTVGTQPLTVNPPPAVRADPALLVWDKDAAPEPKTIVVRLPPESPAKIVSAAASSENFETRVETVREDIEYRVIVTPKATAQPGLAVLSIQSSAGGNATVLRAYAQVRLPPKQ
jgi:hypothetical protein